MNKAYNRINWENYPSDKTPVNEQNLNRIDGATDELDNRVISLDTRKFDKSEAQRLIKNITFDLHTGILKKYYYNGSTEEINTGISKLNMNLRFDKESQILYIINADGTEDPVDLSVFITNYEFEDSDTIAHNVSLGGTVKSIVKDGSITEDKLQPNYLADIKVESAKAEAAATSADTYAKQAQSYAVGTGGVRPNESTENAKYYYEQSRDISQGLAGALIPMGTVTFANLPMLADAESGWMYNVSDQFITTDDFKEGAENVIPAGANVYKTADGKWDVLAGTPVTSVNGQTGNVDVTPENIGALPEGGDSAENIVSFETADAAEANVWTDVDVLVGGEKHKSIFRKVSMMFKNVRYLYKMLGTTNISAIGGGTVTGAIAAQNEALVTVNANLNRQYIQCGAVTCTYYTPYFLRAIVTLPVAYSRAIAGFASKATNVSDASSHVSCLLEGNNKISIFVENKDGIFTSSNKQSVYWMTVGSK